MQNRDHWVDYAKGIGILLVVYGHVSRGAYNAGIVMDAKLFKLIDSIIYSFHMPLFFLLSGIFFIPSLNKYGRQRLILDKVDSVFYPYVLWSLLQGFTEVFLSRFTTAKTSVDDVLSLLWQPRAQFWFLYVLFVVFVLMALTYREQRGAAALFVPLMLIAAWISRFYVQLPFPVDFLATYLIYFYLGSQVRVWKDFIIEHASIVCAISGLLFGCLAWLFHGKLGLIYSDQSLLALPLALSGITMVCSLGFVLAKAELNMLKCLTLFGTCSMPIFLMHILAGSGVRIILNKFLYIDNASIHLILGTVIGILVPITVFQLSKKTSLAGLRYLFAPPPFLSLKRRMN
ncbi:acyltransferase family protein [Undibacterium sp. Dicai25W]|uniref:acyltransferase family protein n=1 Tax=Undibacterium sp. Dicai25W TaxID=3413034 RepID=UPI003BF337E9